MSGWAYKQDRFFVRTKTDQIKSNQIYLLVPLHNWMTRFEAGTQMLLLQMAFRSLPAPKYSDWLIMSSFFDISDQAAPTHFVMKTHL